MQVTELPNLADHRRIDLQASKEAAAALHASAARKRDDAGALASALKSADALLANRDDAAAYARFSDAVMAPEFLSLLPRWIGELREVASKRPDSGACTLATALKLWLWTVNHFDAPLQPRVIFHELAEALTPLLAARCMILDAAADSSELRRDLGHVYAAHVSASAASTCAELVFGYRHHLVWDAEGCATCFASDDLDDLEAVMPGIASGARTTIDIIEDDGSHPAKRGPCAKTNGVEGFTRLRNRLDTCLTGARIAKDRAAKTLAGAPGARA